MGEFPVTGDRLCMIAGGRERDKIHILSLTMYRKNIWCYLERQGERECACAELFCNWEIKKKMF